MSGTSTALAAVLLVVAWNIAEVPEVMRLLRRAPREDLVVLIATIAITVFTDLTYAIAFGVVASMFLLLRQMSRLPAAQALLPQDRSYPPRSLLVGSPARVLRELTDEEIEQITRVRGRYAARGELYARQGFGADLSAFRR